MLESCESSLEFGLDEVLLSVVRMERGILEIRWSSRLRDYKAIGIKGYIKWGGVDNVKVEKSMDGSHMLRNEPLRRCNSCRGRRFHDDRWDPKPAQSRPTL